VTHETIDRLIKSNPVVLFMKGNRTAPQCGFSATVVGLLDQYLDEYHTVNVLEDPQLREGIKAYTNWPTIPQLYVNGEFVGGCDIVTELEAQGELRNTLGELVTDPTAPEVTITPAAADVFHQALAEAEAGERLYLSIDAGFRHDLALALPSPGDIEVTQGGFTLAMDRATARRAGGLCIDYVHAPQAGFKIDNPNAPASVRQLSAKEAHALVTSDPNVRFIDVRTAEERDLTKIEGTVRLTHHAFDELMQLDRDTKLVFHCHHGVRSHQAALQFVEKGFKHVYNVVGGIDAWSDEVDPSIAKY
jgi:monothiol glutaredoxin